MASRSCERNNASCWRYVDAYHRTCSKRVKLVRAWGGEENEDAGEDEAEEGVGAEGAREGRLAREMAETYGTVLRGEAVEFFRARATGRGPTRGRSVAGLPPLFADLALEEAAGYRLAVAAPAPPASRPARTRRSGVRSAGPALAAEGLEPGAGRGAREPRGRGLVFEEAFPEAAPGPPSRRAGRGGPGPPGGEAWGMGLEASPSSPTPTSTTPAAPPPTPAQRAPRGPRPAAVEAEGRRREQEAAERRRGAAKRRLERSAASSALQRLAGAPQPRPGPPAAPSEWAGPERCPTVPVIGPVWVDLEAPPPAGAAKMKGAAVLRLKADPEQNRLPMLLRARPCGRALWARRPPSPPRAPSSPPGSPPGRRGRCWSGPCCPRAPPSPPPAPRHPPSRPSRRARGGGGGRAGEGDGWFDEAGEPAGVGEAFGGKGEGPVPAPAPASPFALGEEGAPEAPPLPAASHDQTPARGKGPLRHSLARAAAGALRRAAGAEVEAGAPGTVVGRPSEARVAREERRKRLRAAMEPRRPTPRRPRALPPAGGAARG
eukprot:tig00000622_g2635.t1